MTTNVKKVAADIVSIGVVVSAVLAVVIAVAHHVNLPAPYVAWIIIASSVVGALVNIARPFARETAAKMVRTLKGKK